LHIEVSTAGEFAKIGKKITDVFDKCYYSYAMGMAKPDVEIFEAVIADAGVTAKECLFLDDGPKNTEQAAKLGIQTYLVDINEDLSFLLDNKTWTKE
jgi:putative hydrolase of the HAD superfamily